MSESLKQVQFYYCFLQPCRSKSHLKRSFGGELTLIQQWRLCSWALICFGSDSESF